jgi:adenylate cyclase
MKKKIAYLFIWLSLILVTAINGSQGIILNEYSGEQSLSNYLSFYEDKTNELEIKDILSTEVEKKFIKNEKAYPAFGFSKSTIWGKFTVKNESKISKDWYLAFNFPHLEKITLYFPDENGKFYVSKIGKEIPFSDRIIKHRLLISPLQNLGTKEKTIYFQVQSNETLEFPMSIMDTSGLAMKNYEEMFISGSYYGILLIMFFYNLFIFISIRDRSYFYYIFYILLYGLAQAGLDGYLDQIIKPERYQYVRDFRVFAPTITIIIVFLFTDSYLSLDEKFPKIHRLIIRLIPVTVIPVIVYFFTGFYFAVQLSIVLMLASSILQIVIGFIAARKSESARYYLIAWIFFLVGVIIFSLKAANIFIPVLTTYAMQFGNVLEVAVLSFGLGDRFRLLQIEKELVSETFGKVVDPAIRDHLLNGNMEMGGEEKNATILFCDIRKFTELSEKYSPREVVTQLNQYFETISNSIRNHHGLVNKYIGDALLALFNVPIEDSQHCDNALRAAISMDEDVQTLNIEFKKQGMQPLKMGIGIHSGPVLAGNIGSSVRMEYTVIGDNVNIASRIEGLNKLYNVPILASSNVIDNLGNVSEFNIREIDKVRLKGKSKAVKIFEVFNTDPVEIKNKKISQLEAFAYARSLFLEKKLEAAKMEYFKMLQESPYDTVLKVMLDRCNALIVNPPDTNTVWDGSLVLEFK